MSELAFPKSFEAVVEFLAEFPGVGRRTAERLGLTLISWPEEKIRRLGELIAALPDTVSFCPVCGNLSEGEALCRICSSCSRDQSMICVVEDFPRIRSIEKGGFYKGVYHVLGGKLSPLSGVEAGDLNVDGLLGRITDGAEVILALGQDVEGRATAAYVLDLLSSRDVKVTRLASGLPVGADFSFADAATIMAAMDGRITVCDR